MQGARDATELLTGFVSAIRMHQWLQGAWIIFCCERNMAHEAGFLTEPLLVMNKVVGIAQHEYKDYGWWTDNPTKVKMAYEARRCMAMNSVFYMKDFICTNPWDEPTKRREKVKRKFEEQMKRFKPVMSQPRDPHSTPRITISGMFC